MVNLDHLELKEREEKEVKAEARVPRVIEVFLVFKVFLVLWYVNASNKTTLFVVRSIFLQLISFIVKLRVLKETKVRLVLPVLQVNQGNLVQEDLLVVMELPVLKVSWDHLALVVVKVSLVNLVHLALLVLLDLLDLLVNQWAMTLLLWQQSLGKAKLR